MRERSAAALALSTLVCLSAPTLVGADSNKPAQRGTSAVTPELAGSTSSPEATPLLRPEPIEVRLENARTVNVATTIMGIELGSTLEEAHARWDELSDPGTPPKEEEEERESAREQRKVLWRLAETDYHTLFVKADKEDRITSITALLRPGREQPFDQIGEISKAPLHSESQVAWDVLRPERPLMRVVATGTDNKASTVLIFYVKRAGDEKNAPD